MSTGNTTDWLQSFKSYGFKAKLENQFAHLISFTGGKGGVGKTTLALKFSWELAQLGKKVLVIDCDFNLSNTLIKLGLPINSNFYDVINYYKEFEDCIHKNGNFHLLPACNGNLEVFDKEQRFSGFIFELIKNCEDKYDFIVLDCPAGLTKDVLTLNAICDSRIFVLNPDKSSLTDSYSMMKVLKKRFGISENHLIVNNIESKDQYFRIAKSISETVEEFLQCRTVVLGGVSRDNTRSEDFDRGFLENKNSIFHKEVCKVLERYAEKLLELSMQNEHGLVAIKRMATQDVQPS